MMKKASRFAEISIQKRVWTHNVSWFLVNADKNRKKRERKLKKNQKNRGLTWEWRTTKGIFVDPFWHDIMYCFVAKDQKKGFILMLIFSPKGLCCLYFWNFKSLTMDIYLLIYFFCSFLFLNELILCFITSSNKILSFVERLSSGMLIIEN